MDFKQRSTTDIAKALLGVRVIYKMNTKHIVAILWKQKLT